MVLRSLGGTGKKLRLFVTFGSFSNFPGGRERACGRDLVDVGPVVCSGLAFCATKVTFPQFPELIDLKRTFPFASFVYIPLPLDSGAAWPVCQNSREGKWRRGKEILVSDHKFVLFGMNRDQNERNWSFS